MSIVRPWIEETHKVDEEFWFHLSSSNDTKEKLTIKNASDLASITDDFDVIEFEGPITSLSENALNLLSLLQNGDRIWESVEIDSKDGENHLNSPAFLKFLIAALKNTKCLRFCCFLLDTAASGCIASSLLAKDGIQELDLFGYEHDLSFEYDSAKVLAESMACSTCLQRFRLRGDEWHHFDYFDVCFVLSEGLKRNRSLEALELSVSRFGRDGAGLPELFRGLQTHPKLRELHLRRQDLSDEAMEALREWLSHGDCRLQDLQISMFHEPEFFKMSFIEDIRERAFKSETVQRLELSEWELSSDILEGLCHTFPNLRELLLPTNSICDLSTLESILCKEDCKIQVLDLRWNCINQDSIVKFAAKIPLMKSLRRLHLSFNPFLEDISSLSLDEKEQNTMLQLLLKSVKSSKSLEQLSMDSKIDATELCHRMNVNRGFRCGIEVNSANRCISLKLWPRILHRASSIKYFAGIDSNRDGPWIEVMPPTDKSPRATIVFLLLRDHANILEHLKTDIADVSNV